MIIRKNNEKDEWPTIVQNNIPNMALKIPMKSRHGLAHYYLLREKFHYVILNPNYLKQFKQSSLRQSTTRNQSLRRIHTQHRTKGCVAANGWRFILPMDSYYYVRKPT